MYHPLQTNVAKTFLAKGKPTFINGQVNLLNKKPKNRTDVSVLENCSLAIFITVKKFLAKELVA